MATIENLKKVVLIKLDVHCWSGRKKLKPEDLGVDKRTLPPAEIASLGSKKIYNPKRLAVFNRLKRRAERACELSSVKFLGCYAAPVDKINGLHAQLEKIRTEYDAERDLLRRDFQQEQQQWIAAHPDWAAILNKTMTTAESALSRISYDFQIFQVESPADEMRTVSRGLYKAAGGLKAQLFKEVANEARATLEASVLGKNTLTRKVLRPLYRLVEKMAGLTFLDPEIDVFIKNAEAQLAAFPKDGPIEGVTFDRVLSLYQSFTRLGTHDTSGATQLSMPQSTPSNVIPLISPPDDVAEMLERAPPPPIDPVDQEARASNWF